MKITTNLPLKKLSRKSGSDHKGTTLLRSSDAIDIPSLGSMTSIPESTTLSFTSGDYGSDFSVKVRVDTNSSIAESDEMNNVSLPSTPFSVHKRPTADAGDSNSHLTYTSGLTLPQALPTGRYRCSSAEFAPADYASNFTESWCKVDGSECVLPSPFPQTVSMPSSGTFRTYEYKLTCSIGTLYSPQNIVTYQVYP